jgi:inhibitor of cysteine peptidase
MKTTVFAMIAIAVVVGSLAACQLAGEPIRISERDAGKIISMRTGGTLAIALQGNTTTGFNWIPAPQDPVLLNQLGEAQVTPESDQLGAPQTIVLQFEAVAHGQTVLRLNYRRSWETDLAPEKTFEVTVVVK